MREAITAALKAAMTSGEKDKVSTLRMMQAAIKDRDIEVRTQGRATITEDEMLALFQKMVKQRQESAALYEQGNRPELADKEKAEIAVIQSFMPQQLSADETRAALTDIIKETGASSMKDMGKIMPVLKARYTGRMDMGLANSLMKELLGAA